MPRPSPLIHVLAVAAKLFATAAFLLAFIVFWAWFFRPPQIHEVRELPPEVVAEAEERRATRLEVDDPPVLHRTVDYREGPAAAWWPRRQSPLLDPLVAEGSLPPVAERTGPEPAVIEGIDGVGEYGGTWFQAIGSEFDFTRIRDTLSGGALVRWSPHGPPIVPHIARDFEVSDDHRVYTFHLRRGMRWSDGHPFTADDLLFWWEYDVLQPDFDLAGDPPNFMKTRGEYGTVEKIDDHTVRFSFPHPNAAFLDRIATSSGIDMVNTPAHYLRRYHPVTGDPDELRRAMRALQLPNPRSVYARIKNPNNPEHPRLWPWVYRTHKATPPYAFVRNPYYFAVDPEGNQLPYMDRVLKDVKSARMIAGHAAGGAYTIQPTYVGFNNYTLFMTQGPIYGYQVYHWYNANASDYLINVNVNRRVTPGDRESRNKADLLNERRFRQALSLAINRRAIIETEFSGLGRPAQAAPRAESPYHHPELEESFIRFDPARANQLLDDLGLTERDLDGYRLFADGARMHFFISVAAFFSAEVAQLIADDWRAVGVRATVRERARQLFYAELEGLQHDFSIWGSNDEFNPVVQPRLFVPVAWDSDFARGWSRWYNADGLYGSERAARLPFGGPPPEHPLYETMLIYEQVKEAPTLEERIELMDRILAIAAENLWTISIATSLPTLFIVSDEVRNVPATALSGWNYITPSNTGIETYWLTESRDSPGAIAAMRQEILEVTPWPHDVTGTAVPRSRFDLAWLVRFLIYGSLVAGLALLALRHPFVLQRLVIMVPTLLIISIVSFVIIQLPPGDFLSYRIVQLQESGSEMAEAEIQELRDLFHLEDGAFRQYLRWMGMDWFLTYDKADRGLLQGYLGRSMDSLESVNIIMGDRLLLTILLSAATIIFTWMMALPIGIYSAVRQYSIGDYIFSLIGFLGMSIPGFLLAIVMMYLSLKYFNLNISGLFSPEYAGQPEWTWGKFVDLLQHLWLPVVIIGVSGTAGMIRVMRGNLLDELKKPYVTTALAKGVRPIRLLFKYPVRIALNPFISGIGGIFPELIGGGAIVSLVLSLPTIGPLLLDALMMEDLYMAGSMLMVLSLLGVMGTLVSDLLLLALDPRIRMEGGTR